jgi:hypothetical protein
MTLLMFFAISFSSGFAQRASALARGIAGHSSMPWVIRLHVLTPLFEVHNLHLSSYMSDIPRYLHRMEYSKVQAENMNLDTHR